MKRFACFCATVLLLFALMTVTAQQTYANNEYFEVFFEGEALGVVSCPDEVRDMLADMLDLRQRHQGYQVSMDESIHFVARNAMQLPELTPLARIRGHIEDQATFVAHAISIHVDDVVIGVVSDEDEANRIFRELKAAYIADRESDDHTRVLSATIRQDIRMEQHPVNPEVIRSAHTVKRLLQQGDELILRYRVQEGETAWGIAEVAGLSVEALAAVNPGIRDISTLRPGDEIRTVELQPAISFVSEEEQWSIRPTPFEVEERKDDTLWAWQRVVQQQGKQGEVRVVVRTVMDNGQEVQREVVSEEEVSAPVTHIIRQGTKQAPRAAAPANGGFLRPARGGMLTSPFGWRGREFHQGIDLAMPIGSPVYASKSGTVTAAGWRGSYGNIVTISHGGNQVTLYAHLNQVLVAVGNTVSQGQVIAHSGNTGRSTGPHLHFEIHTGGSAQNPLNYISR